MIDKDLCAKEINKLIDVLYGSRCIIKALDTVLFEWVESKLASGEIACREDTTTMNIIKDIRDAFMSFAESENLK